MRCEAAPGHGRTCFPRKIHFVSTSMLSTSSAPDAGASPALPSTRGRLAEAAADPLGTLRRQYETHGEISAFEDAGQRVIFVFGPEYNQRVLSDTETFHSYFFPI